MLDPSVALPDFTRRLANPIFAGLLREGFEAAWQILGLGPGDERKPDHVGAGGKAFEVVFEGLNHPGVIGFKFVTRVHQHQATPAWGWQEFLAVLETVFAQDRDLALRPQLLDVLFQKPCIGRVQLKQFEFIVISK